MSYDIDEEGNKFFYEPELIKEEHERNNPLSFDDWYEIYKDDLQSEYIEDNPEEFGTDESIINIEQSGNYQSFTECKYDTYIENITR